MTPRRAIHESTSRPKQTIENLLGIMAALREPDTGCPWDIKQTFETIAHYTLEEAAEVVDAIQRGDRVDLRDELGDLLLQVVFHARLAEDEGSFSFADVVEAICTKMRRRHPHVFGDKGPLPIDAVNALWATIKQEEKAERAALRKAAGLPQPESGILAGVLPTQPALARAMKLQQRAASVGFDWDDPRPVLAKIKEEIAEVEEALERGNEAAVADEVGDLLFAVTNLARHVGTDAESALHGTCAKVTRRFRHIEQSLAAAGRETNDATLAEMEALWAAAKMLEKPAL